MQFLMLLEYATSYTTTFSHAHAILMVQIYAPQPSPNNPRRTRRFMGPREGAAFGSSLLTSSAGEGLREGVAGASAGAALGTGTGADRKSVG